ncbi:folylpolyglutamate synthase/dihydrofolate synthase family protein [uncultured Clostridium sp.]|jgi:dihydrofolate synthase/folylpolyglutamate synthase|uniref:bifunctional folylpolyglutamate synthase/dihydrofolate synthase n=1 Tax=uncultured Clostridium sp. TaxID=59620 RepID=UPI00262FFF18|nr:folylpolyglutamate synthase/dihydrofolate synthase family protein [uncultured Clostridium sp.]
MKYDEAMEYIASTSRFGMNFGLERVETMLSLLGNPEKNLKCIHIAGTNGKGSTTAMITSILKEEGYTIGMYTSPYLEEFEERIQINGVNIPKEKLAKLVTEIKEAIDEVVKRGFDNPTQFEIITALMFLYFSREKTDFVVLEVGLGGRLDATNVINPLISVIASISHDHMNILGNTITEIAGEKCGIIKNSPVISYPQVEDAMKVVEDTCKLKKVELTKASLDSIKSVKANKESNTQLIEFNLNNRDIIVEHGLLGEHQVKNTLVALNVIDKFSKIIKPIKDDTIKAGISKTKWIGRMEVMRNEPLVVIDGAHNLDGIRSLKNSVKTYFNYKNIVLVLGILGDKEVEKMVSDISSISKTVILTEPHNDRAKNIDEMGECLENLDKPYEKILDYKDAYKRALEIANNDDLILICGSLYMIGDMRKVIRNS